MNVQSKIKSLREKNNISQSKLAAESGMTRESISKLENSKRFNPHLNTVAKLASSFKITLADFFAGVTIDMKNKKRGKK